jgi:hypothetical protein
MNLPRNLVIGIWIGLILVVLCGTLYLNLINLGTSFRLSAITGRDISAGVTTETYVLLPPSVKNFTIWLDDHGIGDYVPGDIILNWSLDDYPFPIAPASDYNMYMSDNYTAGFNFMLPNATLPNTTTTYVDGSASQKPQRYYIIRTDNPSPFKDVNTNTWGKINIYLTSASINGLNLVSIPMLPADKTFGKVLIQNTTNYYVYQVSTRNDTSGSWYTADYLGEYGFDMWFGSPSSFTTVDPDKAYWFKSRYSKTFVLTGEVAVSDRHVPLINTSAQNLNFVGWTSIDKQAFSQAIQQNPSDYYAYQVSTRNDTTGAWYTADYLGEYGFDMWFGSPTFFTSFEPGHGYWLKSRYNVVWNYTPNHVMWK